MSIYSKYCKRILKQYGKNIKSFEKRLEEPLEMTRISKDLLNFNIIERRVEMPYFLKRGTRKLESYQDIVKYSIEGN